MITKGFLVGIGTGDYGTSVGNELTDENVWAIEEEQDFTPFSGSWNELTDIPVLVRTDGTLDNPIVEQFNGNLNNIISTSLIWANGSSTNLPSFSSAGGSLMTTSLLSGADTFGAQFWIGHGSDDEMGFRKQTEDVWSSWKQVATREWVNAQGFSTGSTSLPSQPNQDYITLSNVTNAQTLSGELVDGAAPNFPHLAGFRDGGGINISYQTAIQTASSYGARLPTIEELEDGIVAGTGFTYDNEITWSCSYAGVGKVYGIAGDGTGSRVILDINTGTAAGGYVVNKTVSWANPLAEWISSTSGNYIADSGETILSSAVNLRIDPNPASGERIFSVESEGNSARFVVQHDGAITTSNPDIYVNTATDGTGGDLVATRTWANSQFDNYGSWNLQANGGTSTGISSGETINFSGSGVTRNGNTININSEGRTIDENITSSGFYNFVNGKTFIVENADIAVDIPDGDYTGQWGRIINNTAFGAVRFDAVNSATINGVSNVFVAPNGGEVIIVCEGNNTWTAYGDIRTSSTYSEPVGKPIKTISSSSYTIVGEDHSKWLRFTNNCTVTVPNLASRYLIEGETDDGVTISFQSQSGVTLRKLASIGLTLSPNGVFGIKYNTSINAIIYGTDPI